MANQSSISTFFNKGKKRTEKEKETDDTLEEDNYTEADADADVSNSREDDGVNDMSRSTDDSPAIDEAEVEAEAKHADNANDNDNACTTANATDNSMDTLHNTNDNHHGLSPLEISTQRTASFITVTLSAAADDTDTATDTATDPIKDSNGPLKSKRDLLRMQWEQTCFKWGFVVVRQLTYVQKTFSDVMNVPDDSSTNATSNDTRSSKIIINGCEALKDKDELVISKLIRPSPAHSAGVQEDDIIHAVYGMKDPNLSLLFGIMRDSMTFQLSIRRMETPYERTLRTNPDALAPVSVPVSVSVPAPVPVRNHSNSNDKSDKLDMQIDKQRMDETIIESVGEQQQKNREPIADAEELAHASEQSTENESDHLQIPNPCTRKPKDAAVPEGRINANNNFESRQVSESHPNTMEQETEYGAAAASDNFDDDDINFNDDIFAAVDAAVLERQSQSQGSQGCDSNHSASNDIVHDTRVSPVTTLAEKSGVEEQESSGHAGESHTPNTRTNRHDGGGDTHGNPHEDDINGEGVVNDADNHLFQYSDDGGNGDGNDEDEDEDPNLFGESMDDASVEMQQEQAMRDVQEWGAGGNVSPDVGNSLVAGNEVRRSRKIQGENLGLVLENGDEALISSDQDAPIPSGISASLQRGDEHAQAQIEQGGPRICRNKEEDLLTSLIEKSINDDDDSRKSSSREKKAKKKAKKRKLSEDSTRSTSPKPPKESKSKLKKIRRPSEDSSAKEVGDKDGSDETKSTSPKQPKESKSKFKKIRRPSEDSTAKEVGVKDGSDEAKSKRKKDRKLSEDVTTKKPSRSDSIDQSMNKKDRRLSEDASVDKPARSDSIDESTSKSKRKQDRKLSEDASSGKPPRQESTDDSKKKRKKDRQASKNLNDTSVTRSGSIDETEIKGKTDRKLSEDASADKARRSPHVESPVRKQRLNSISSINDDFPTNDGSNRPLNNRLPRASPLTVSRTNSATTVSSTSSKAGLSTGKTAKLKRLWPDSSVFTKRILKWCPPQVLQEGYRIRFKGPAKSNLEKDKLPVIPSTFRDTSEIVKFMSPHILEEGIHSGQQEFSANSDRKGIWTRDVFSMQLRVSLSTATFVMTCLHICL